MGLSSPRAGDPTHSNGRGSSRFRPSLNNLADLCATMARKVKAVTLDEALQQRFRAPRLQAIAEAILGDDRMVLELGKFRRTLGKGEVWPIRQYWEFLNRKFGSENAHDPGKPPDPYENLSNQNTPKVVSEYYLW